MPNRCRVSESTRLPEPGLECIWPAPGNGGALPVQDRSWAFRGGELGFPLIFQGQLFWGFFGAAAGAVFLFSLIFLVFFPRVCRNHHHHIYSRARDPPTHRDEREKRMGRIWHMPAAVCLSVRTARANLTWKGGTVPFSLPDCLAQPTKHGQTCLFQIEEGKIKQTDHTERLDRGGDGCTPRRVAAVALQEAELTV